MSWSGIPGRSSFERSPRPTVTFFSAWRLIQNSGSPTISQLKKNQAPTP